MFLNPFATKEKVSPKTITKIKIIADIHEKDSMIFSQLKSSPEIELIIQSLKIGDYLVGNTIIERKTTNDFISSMINKRLSIQLKNMQQYNERILIIEGNLSEHLSLREDGEGWRAGKRINPNAIRGFILSIITNYQTPIIFTTNYKDTSKYLITLAKQQISKTSSSLHSRIPKTIEEQKQYILESFPTIGEKKAKMLLEKFHSLKNTFSASEEDLKEVLKNQSSSFKNLLDS